MAAQLQPLENQSAMKLEAERPTEGKWLARRKRGEKEKVKAAALTIGENRTHVHWLAIKWRAAFESDQHSTRVCTQSCLDLL